MSRLADNAPSPVAGSSPAEAEEVVEETTYRGFVKAFMNKVIAENPGISPKDAMRKCGVAWKEHKEGLQSAASATAGGVSKSKDRRPRAAIVLPSLPTTITDVSNYIAAIREEGQASESPSFSRSVAIAIPRTKQVHRQLKNNVRQFLSEVKTGKLPNMEQAYIRGFNALLQLGAHL